MRPFNRHTADIAQRGRWPIARRTQIRFFPGEQRDFQRTAERLFRCHVPPDDWAGLAGAPPEALLELGTAADGLYLEFHEPRRQAYSAARLIQATPAGLMLIDDGIRIRSQRLRAQRLGLSIFRRQLKFATRWGLAGLRLVAGRRADENGYYTWPRLGFDGLLPECVRRSLPPQWRAVRRILELMVTPAGRTWWRAHGVTLELVFDLEPGSPCWQAFRRYLAEKRPPPAADAYGPSS